MPFSIEDITNSEEKRGFSVEDLWEQEEKQPATTPDSPPREQLDLIQEKAYLRKPTALMSPEEVDIEYQDIGRSPQEKALAERARAAKRDLPPREEGVREAFGTEFERAFTPIGQTPYVLSAKDEDLQNYILARQQEIAEAPQRGGGASLAAMAGGIVGNVLYYGGASRGGLPGLAAAGGVQNAYEVFDRVSQRALAEGKSPTEAARLGKAAMGIGAVTGAAGGAAGPARAATSFRGASGKGVKFGTAAGLGRVAENLAEQQLGLQTPVWEGVFETAATTGVIPPVLHAAGRAISGNVPREQLERTPDAIGERPVEVRSEPERIGVETQRAATEASRSDSAEGSRVVEAEPQAPGREAVQAPDGDVLLAKPQTDIAVPERELATPQMEVAPEVAPIVSARPEAQPVRLTPAITVAGKTFTGRSHAEITAAMARAGIVDVITGKPERGFVDDSGTFITRKDAAALFEQQTGKKVGKPDEGLRSEDLRDAKLLEHVPAEPQPLAAPVQAAALTPEASLGPGAAKPREFEQRVRAGDNPPLPPTKGTAPVASPEPNIEVSRVNKDFNIFNNANTGQWSFYFGRLGEAAKKAYERIVLGEYKMREDINRDVRQTVEAPLAALPRKFRKAGGKAFFDVLDGKTMESIEADYAGQPQVIEAARAVKTRLDEIRTTIRDTKRDSSRAYFSSLDRPTLEDLFRSTISNADPARFTKEQMSDALTLSELPDDWGIADGTYLPHLFFGQYKVSVKMPGADAPSFVTRANTVGEAKAQIYKLTKDNPDLANADFSVAQDSVVPADMIRLGDRQFWSYVRQMKDNLGVSAGEIKDAQRGFIGRKSSRHKWFGSLQRRLGAQNYSTDFKRAMTAYLSGFHRWKELSSMQREVQPLIEQVGREGRTAAAQRLSDIMENEWGKPARSTVQFDNFIKQVPGLRDFIKPLALDRWSRNMRSMAAMMTLRTLRFAVVNRLQPLQGLYPVVGERLLVQGKRLQHTPEGKALLEEAGVTQDVGQYGEPGTPSKISRLTERLSGERANNEWAFLSMYLHGTEQGMAKPDAIRYAKLRGQLMTQFTPLVADTPPLFEGPFGQLAFQFKRFPVKQTELLASMVRDKNIPGIVRMLGVFGVMGGASFFLRQSFQDKEKQLRLKRSLEKELGKTTSKALMYGLPGLLGADLSGSIVLGDEPMGANVYEKVGRQITGPAVSLAYETGKSATKAARQKVSGTDKAKAVLRRIPSLKPLADLSDLITGNVDVTTPDGEIKYRRTIGDALAGLGSFRSANESSKQLTVSAIMELKREMQGLKNQVYVGMEQGNADDAIKAVQSFNQRWPEAAITGEEMDKYIKYRQNRSQKTKEESIAGQKFAPLLAR